MSHHSRYPERLDQIAADAYELSARLCSGCGDLHALWPYIRLTRASTGVEARQSALQSELCKLFDLGLRDGLIAGCQDTGLLALVARAAIDYDIKVTVLDICETPPELCRRTAKQWSMPIATLRRDLAALEVEAAFDFVLVHGTLNFIPADRRLEALTRMRRALRPGGQLVLFFNTGRTAIADNRHYGEADYGGWVLSELKRLKVTLPDSEPALRQRLYRHDGRRQMREAAFAEPAEVELLVEHAGFKVEACRALDLNVPLAMKEVVASIAKRRFMLFARVEVAKESSS
jgi:SAM-dependent methyltransferase